MYKILLASSLCSMIFLMLICIGLSYEISWAINRCDSKKEIFNIKMVYFSSMVLMISLGLIAYYSVTQLQVI